MYSDCVIITSDNPRGENPSKIADEIVPGLKQSGLKRVALDDLSSKRGYEIILDREKAIHAAVTIAKQGSKGIIVIAGKGHETYQIMGNRKRYFDDVEVVKLAAG